MLNENIISKQFGHKNIFDTLGKKDVSLIIIMPTRLVIVGSPTHQTLIAMSKGSLENMIHQKTKSSSWKWQILPMIKLSIENYDYSVLDEFRLTDFLSSHQINNN